MARNLASPVNADARRNVGRHRRQPGLLCWREIQRNIKMVGVRTLVAVMQSVRPGYPGVLRGMRTGTNVSYAMRFPADLADWDYYTVLNIVRTAEFEPSTFDYKELLTPSRGESQEFNTQVCRTVVSMANTLGGYILFGVLDRKHPVARAEDRIKGIPLGDDLRRLFGDKLNAVQPEVSWDAVPAAIPLPDIQARGVFVVHVPPSSRRPHMIGSEGRFYRRGDGGTAITMNVYEVRDQMLLTEERLRKVTMLRLEITLMHEVAERLIADADNVDISLLQFDTSAFKSLVADVCPLLSDQWLQQLLAIPMYTGEFNQARTLGYDRREILFDMPGQTHTENRRFHRERLVKQLENIRFHCDQAAKMLSTQFGRLHDGSRS